MSATEELDPSDYFSLWIGRVARSHARLDSFVRDVHHHLLMPSLGIHLTEHVPSTSAVIKNCRIMLSNADDLEHVSLPLAIRAAGDTALTAADAVNSARNKIVHTMWLVVQPAGRSPVADGPSKLRPPIKGNTFREKQAKQADRPPQPTPSTNRDLGSFKDVYAALERSIHQLVGLQRGLLITLPHFRGVSVRTPGLSWDEEIAQWVNVMEGRFRPLNDGVSYETWAQNQTETSPQA